MCGRYTLIRLADFTDMFPWIRLPAGTPGGPGFADTDAGAIPRYNIAPTQPVAVVPNDGRLQIDFFRWGLIPSWAKDPSIGNRMINARVEGISEKPAYRSAVRRRRCLIPASGFYEWKKPAPDRAGGKTPMYIRSKDGRPFAFAGLWETWRAPEGHDVRSCTIITGPPNELVRTIHDRMAVILLPEHYRVWLDEGELSPDALARLLQPYPAELLEAYPVGRAVNTPKNDGPELIRPVEPTAPTTTRSKQAPPGRQTRSASDDTPTLF